MRPQRSDTYEIDDTIVLRQRWLSARRQQRYAMPRSKLYPWLSSILHFYFLFFVFFLSPCRPVRSLVFSPDVPVTLLLVVSDSARFASNNTGNPMARANTRLVSALLRGEQYTMMEKSSAAKPLVNAVTLTCPIR
jgi:hypothetical protein